MNENYNILDDRPKKWINGSCCTYCIHFHGVEKETCEAYPSGVIPDKFSFSKDIHLEIEPNQIKDFVFTLIPQ